MQLCPSYDAVDTCDPILTGGPMVPYVDGAAGVGVTVTNTNYPTSKRYLEQFSGCKSFRPQSSSSCYLSHSKTLYPTRTFFTKPFTTNAELVAGGQANVDSHLVWPGAFFVAVSGIPAPGGTLPRTSSISLNAG